MTEMGRLSKDRFGDKDEEFGLEYVKGKILA